MDSSQWINGRLMGKTVALLSHALDYRSANHNAISGNLANVDTPGYRPREVSFDQELRRAVEKEGPSLERTNPRHLPQRGAHLYGEKGDHALVTREFVPGESNQLNIDKEMAKMVQNNLLYEASARLLAKKFEGLKLAIEGGRR
ncbi:MAG: flagellar basal body rod protein FlgB [Deltaproteobacteria bacterium]|nr:flagellar basal body rod protein FlgB [Deltaproteobacteria bacterium]